MMEAARTSETLVNFYQTTRHYNPEDSHLQKILHLLGCQKWHCSILNGKIGGCGLPTAFARKKLKFFLGD
jgi:hypothetical protein